MVGYRFGKIQQKNKNKRGVSVKKDYDIEK